MRRVRSLRRMARCASSRSTSRASRRSTRSSSSRGQSNHRGCAMRREGSPFQGLGTVTVKEMSDHLSSARMLVLELLVVLTALAALYGAIDNLRQNTAEDPFLLLRLFTAGRDPLPS